MAPARWPTSRTESAADGDGSKRNEGAGYPEIANCEPGALHEEVGDRQPDVSEMRRSRPVRRSRVLAEGRVSGTQSDVVARTAAGSIERPSSSARERDARLTLAEKRGLRDASSTPAQLEGHVPVGAPADDPPAPSGPGKGDQEEHESSREDSHPGALEPSLAAIRIVHRITPRHGCIGSGYPRLKPPSRGHARPSTPAELRPASTTSRFMRHISRFPRRRGPRPLREGATAPSRALPRDPPTTSPPPRSPRAREAV